MKQRKINLVYMLLIAVFVFASCSKSTKNAKFIPGDAAVVCIDVKQIVEKGKLSENEEAKKKVLESFEQGAKNQETKDLCKKIVEDPAKAGVDLREPIFAFITNGGAKSGFLGTILDQDDFTALLNAFAKESGADEVKEKDGIKYLQQGQGGLIAFNDALFFASETYTLDEVVAKFNGDDTQDTMEENEDFSKLLSANGLIKGLVPLVAADGNVIDGIKNNLPEGAELKDLSILISLTTEKGVAKIDYEALAKSDAWKNYIKNNVEVCQKIEGDYVKYLPKGAFMIYSNFDGKKIFELLEKHDVLKQLGVDSQKELAKKVLESINGDFALGVGQIKGDLPDVAVYIKTKDGSLSDIAKESGLKPEQGIDFGFKDGTTFVSTVEGGAFKEAKEGFDKSNISGRRLYLFCDLGLIGELASSFGNANAGQAKAAADYVSAIEFYNTSDEAGEIVLQMKDKEKDPIEFIIQIALQQFN